MMQVAIAVAAGLAIVSAFVRTPSPSLLTTPVAAVSTTYEVAGDGVNAPLPSSQAPPTAGFGTPVVGASPMPSAKGYTHNMFGN